jgi:hypothetical protein
MPECKYCNQEIVWSEEEDDSGELKWIPQDPYSGIRHRCRECKSIYIPNPIRCYRCNAAITFGDLIGRNGKKVPLDIGSRERHRCAGQ